MQDTRDESYTHRPDTEPIPGYRLLSPLGRGGFGEVWKCEAPGGLLKAIKFVPGNACALETSGPADEERRAINRVKTIRHPFILSMERVEIISGELVIVTELADRSLGDVLADARAAGKPGISRDVLLAYLREAAEALDVMHVRHGLQHLDVKPQNLFLVSDHVKVGDFGLVQSVSGGTNNVALGAITPLYAPPEVFQGRISTHCDQYSLAIVYQELLTGTTPYTGKNSRQLMMLHVQGEPDLTSLPEADRKAIARALSKDPAGRYRSCSDLVTALASGHGEASATVVDLPVRSIPDDDTRRTPSMKTVRAPSTTARPPVGPEEAAGLRFTGLLARTPHSETWAATQDGEARLVKVLFAKASPEAAARLANLGHPTLLPMEVLHIAPGKLVLATPTGDRTLRDVFAEMHAQGQGGIPRGQLLRWLREAADALAELSHHEGLYHLALNPRTLLLREDRLAVADFGLSQLVWRPSGQALAALNPRYSAPELARGEIGPACDQYSLAVIYHELTTGALPVAGLPRVEPRDRPAVARALDADPNRRWPDAASFLQALEHDGVVELGGLPSAAARPVLTMRAERARPRDGTTQARLGTNLPAEVIRKRLDGFAKQWSAQSVAELGDARTYRVQAPPSLWNRGTGTPPGVELGVEVGRPDVDAAPVGVQVRTEVVLTMRARECPAEQTRELLDAVGPAIVESVRQHLRASARGRQHERVLWPYPLQVCPILTTGDGPPVECQGKDVSLDGIGFYLPGQLPGSLLRLRLPKTPHTAEATVPARVVRVQGCGAGWYEVGAVLLPPDELPDDEDP